MKCPYCGYSHGWDNNKLEHTHGLNGEFYKVSNKIQMERDSDYESNSETKDLYGCPNCNKVFMD